ncbi:MULTISPECIES: hypothetical protein [unclassified Psychrobacter]|uniref:hypothetical protein n=1 Tax=unclassified Psychrobacter TaxID=196806 RepID=UPI0018F49736|nr:MULTISPECIES: hypothetical protein [unclassified Psychrobacter]
MNWALFSIVFAMASTVSMGLCLIAALVFGFNGTAHILIAVAVGILIAIPAGLFFTKKISRITGKEEGYGF